MAVLVPIIIIRPVEWGLAHGMTDGAPSSVRKKSTSSIYGSYLNKVIARTKWYLLRLLWPKIEEAMMLNIA